MVERRKELDRRYQRKKKMAKLKAKLAAAKDPTAKDTILKKIRLISPWWVMPKATA
jgi:hypothetical protein